MQTLLTFLAVVALHLAGSVSLPGNAAASDRSAPANDAIRILPIGDSVTQGGRADRPEYTYRHPLYFMLLDAGYKVDFIGSMRAGLQPQATWPDRNGVPFDLDHEAHYGWKTAQVRDRLRDVLPKYHAPADMALIHLGSNDVHAKDHEGTIIQPLKDIVGLLRRQNPRVVVLIGHLLEGDRNSRATRPLIDGLAKEISTPQSPVITVRHYEGWGERPGLPSSDTFDWAHPNPQGQKKMADKWFAAMLPYLKR